MKGPFSVWSMFGITLFIDLITYVVFLFKTKTGQVFRTKLNKPRRISVIIPTHMESGGDIEKTVNSIYREKYPLKKVIVCGDPDSIGIEEIVKNLSAKFSRDNLIYIQCPERSKAKKINFVASNCRGLGDFIYVRDCRVLSENKCIKKMAAYFDRAGKVAAVTSYGRLTPPKSFMSRTYYYGKEWINELGRFRKGAQEKRRAVFVICGASTMYRKKILQKFPIPSNSKTEDTHYTWVLQIKGYIIRVANNASVYAPDVDGKRFMGVKTQLMQSYRWSSGTIQCIYTESKTLPKNKRLFYTTVAPGFIEALMYSIALILIPFLFFVSWPWALGFLIGDTFFSLVSTLIFIPKRFFKFLIHYPQIFVFKYLNAIVFIYAFAKVSYQRVARKNYLWSNEWIPPQTSIAPEMQIEI